MTRAAVLMWVIPAALAATAQGPVVERARVETRAATDIAGEVRGSGANEPEWLAWRVPMVAGERDLCSIWSDGQSSTRGTWLEGTAPLESRAAPPTAPQATPASPIALEAGTTLVVLVRVVDGAVERVRTSTDDCPLDAGNRRLAWLTSVSPAASLAFLEQLATAGATRDRARTSTTVAAIALHEGPAAEAMLVRLTISRDSLETRSQTASWLARTRGSVALPLLTRLVADERDSAHRRALVTALGQTAQAGALGALLAISRDDVDEGVRGIALRYYARLAPASDLSAVMTRVLGEATPVVQTQGIHGLAARGETGVPILLRLAVERQYAHARREAVRALSRSTDPRATDFLEKLVAER